MNMSHLELSTLKSIAPTVDWLQSMEPTHQTSPLQELEVTLSLKRKVDGLLQTAVKYDWSCSQMISSLSILFSKEIIQLEKEVLLDTQMYVTNLESSTT